MKDDSGGRGRGGGGPVWPGGRGRMAGLIRSHDWAASPLGPITGWSPYLRGAVQVLLDNRAPMLLTWGSAHLQFYNDALIPLLGTRHPAVLGRPVEASWPDAWNVVRSILNEAMSGRSLAVEDMDLTLSRSGRVETVRLGGSFGPWHGPGGRIEGVIATFHETTVSPGRQRIRRETTEETARLTEARRRQGFMLRLEDALHAESDPEAICAAACRLLASWLGTTRAVVIEFATGDIADACVLGDAVTDGGDSLAGERVPPGMSRCLAALRRGGPVAVEEVETSDLVAAQDRVGCVAQGIRALLGFPLLDGDVVKGAVCVLDAAPRAWTPDETRLMKEVAGRLWSTLTRVRDEACLRDSESCFRALVAASSNVVFRTSPRWTEMRQLLGRDFVRDISAPSRTWLTVYVAPPDRQAVLAAVEAAIRTRTVFEMEHRILRTDGSVGWAFSRAVPLLDAAGGIAEWVGMATDITRRKEAEILLRQNEELQRFLLELSDDLRARRDDRDIAEVASRRLADRLEAERCDIVEVDGGREAAATFFVTTASPGQNAVRYAALYSHLRGVTGLLDGAIAVDDVAQEPRISDDMRTALSVFGVGAFIASPAPRADDGTVLLTIVASRAVRVWTQGEVRLVRAVSERVLSAMERVRAEELLAQHQRMEALTQLLGGVAHDTNNLLTVISGNLELVEDRIDDVGARGRIDTILKAIEVGAVFNRRLLAFSGRRQLATRSLSLNDRVRDVTELLTRSMGERVVIATDLASDLWRVCADPGEIDSSIVNLVANARDAVEARGTVTVSTRNRSLSAAEAAQRRIAPGDYVCVEISDKGHGMVPEVLSRSVEPFFTTKPLGRGSGLGLSSVYSFARQSGGFVDIASAPGEGTTVGLCVPRETDPAPKADARSEARAVPEGQGELILVVEDDGGVREVTVGRLEVLGYTVLDASSGEDAIDILRQEPAIDMVLSDVVLTGGLSGYDVAGWVSANRPDVPVLLVTGYEDISTWQAGALAFPCLAKPHGKAQLARAVRAQLDAAAGERAGAE